MKLLILAALGPMSFVAGLGAMVWTSSPTQLLNGQIVMEQAAFCDLFVIETDQGLALAVDESHWPLVISSGTHVSGLRREKGPQRILVEDRAELRIRVLLWQTDWNLAQARFEQECDPSAPGRSFEMQSRGAVLQQRDELGKER